MILLKDYVKSIADSYRTASGVTGDIKGTDLGSLISGLTVKGASPTYTSIEPDSNQTFIEYTDNYLLVGYLPTFEDDYTDEEVLLDDIYSDPRQQISVNNLNFTDYLLDKISFDESDADITKLVQPLTGFVDEEILTDWLGTFVPEGVKVKYISPTNFPYVLLLVFDEVVDYSGILTEVEPSEEVEADVYTTVTIPEGLFKFLYKGGYFKSIECAISANELQPQQM